MATVELLYYILPLQGEESIKTGLKKILTFTFKKQAKNYKDVGGLILPLKGSESPMECLYKKIAV